MSKRRRSGESGTFLFAINHTSSDAKVPLDAAGTELLTGERAPRAAVLPAGAVRVVRLDGEPTAVLAVRPDG